MCSEIQISQTILTDVNSITAHGRSQLSGLILHPHSQQLLSIGHDSSICLWDSTTLILIKRVKILKTSYLTSLFGNQKEILVGTGNGQLVRLTWDLLIISTHLIHNDCLIGIIELADQIVTAGFDGRLCFLGKHDFDVKKTIHLGLPLLKIMHIDDFLYVSANPSFKVDLKTHYVQKVENFQQIIKFKKQMVKSTLQGSLSCEMPSSCFSTNIPCQLLVSLGDLLICLSSPTISLIKISQQFDSICYRSFNLKNTDQIEVAVGRERKIWVGRVDGTIALYQVRAA